MSSNGPTTRMRTRSTMKKPQPEDLEPSPATSSPSKQAKAVNLTLKQAHLAPEGVAMSRDPSLDRVDKGRKRSGLEIPRKLLHSSIAILTTWAYIHHPSVPLIIKSAAIGLIVIALADLLRFQFAWFERAYESLLGYFMRESERDRVNGTIYYLVGVIVVLTFFPRDIATLSIIILSLCDTSASVFGRLFGRYTPKLPLSGTLFGAKKSLAGTIACVVTGTISSYVFWSEYAARGDEGDSSWLPARQASTWAGPPSRDPTFLPRVPSPDSTLPIWALALSSGVVAGFAEAIAIPIPGSGGEIFDDNGTIPILFGLFCTIMMHTL